MDINQIIEDFAQAVQTAGAIRDWAVLNYGRPVQAHEGIDIRDLPRAAGCPAVFVLPDTKQGGGREKTIGIGLVCIVYDSEKPELVHGVIRRTGQRNVEELRQLVFAAIRTAVPDGLFIQAMDAEYVPEARFPMIEVSMRVVISQLRTTGQDKFE